MKKKKKKKETVLNERADRIDRLVWYRVFVCECGRLVMGKVCCLL